MIALAGKRPGRYRRSMRMIVLLLLVLVSGCSTAPLAGFLDTVNPSRGSGERPGPTLEPPR